MANNLAGAVVPIQPNLPPRGSGGDTGGHAISDRDMVEGVHRWGTDGGRVLVNVGDMIDRANRQHSSSASITLLDKDEGLPYGGFRVRNPGMLTVHDLKSAIRNSEARGWTGDVRRSDTGEYTVAFRPLPRGAEHAAPDRYDGMSTQHLLRERPMVPAGLSPPKTT